MIKLKKCGPVKISECCWFYRNERSIEVIYEIRNDGHYMGTVHILIPLSKILGKSK